MRVQTHTWRYTAAHAQQTSPGRSVWPASQKLLTHSEKWEAHSIRDCGKILSADRVTKVDALEKYLWQGMLWAVMHSLDSWPRVASGGWMSRRRGGVAGKRAVHGLKRRRGFKKAEPGVWWAEWCVFLSLCAGLFSQRGHCDLLTLMQWVQTGYRKHWLVLSSACIVCIISSHCLAKALIN